ncbi:MAG: NAD-dependent epimerase/dehydratase family protein [Planctomycetota bacterium]|nr:MAG: NAD-dependent epimerase/dehydratase family protein [Planctomycetota bacterium]
MPKVLVTGANGFIAGYLVQELLDAGWEVVGLDDFRKYGRVRKSYEDHPSYRLVEGDAKDTGLLLELLEDCEHLVAGAAMIGGISYFHTYAYDLLAENERITASTFDAAIQAHRDHRLEKSTVVSSSMVFERTERYPTPEGEQHRCPPPASTYGFQKLATEYFARGAWEQYRLPYTIIRPFNCVGIGERRALGDVEIASGNVKLAMSHVVPDLVQKVLKGQDPLHVLGDGQQVRCYTYGGDIARGIRISLEHPAARNEDFNLSTATATTVLELAERIWKKVHGDERPFRVVHDPPFPYDVQRRIPDVGKAERLLGFRAETPLDAILDEVIPWVREALADGSI